MYTYIYIYVIHVVLLPDGAPHGRRPPAARLEPTYFKKCANMCTFKVLIS